MHTYYFFNENISFQKRFLYFKFYTIQLWLNNILCDSVYTLPNPTNTAHGIIYANTVARAVGRIVDSRSSNSSSGSSCSEILYVRYPDATDIMYCIGRSAQRRAQISHGAVTPVARWRWRGECTTLARIYICVFIFRCAAAGLLPRG